MVRYCLAAGAPVGVLGGGGVGSVARVREVHELPDGRYGLALVGGERFVLERSWLAPFSFGLRLGAVRTFGDAPPADADGGRAARLAIDGALRELAGAGAELTAALPFVRDWPTSRLDALDDEALSFALAEELPVHVSAKRLWLRTQDTAGRLRALAKVLESVVAEVAASQKAALAGEADAAAGAADAAAEQRKPSGGV
jgi:Lon protease-like protein